MAEQKTIALCGERIAYTLERKAVKNINLRLLRETGLVVSAPKNLPLTQIEAVLQKHAKKILETLHAYTKEAQERQQQYPKTYTTGETVLYLGNYYALSVERGSREGVQIQGETMLLLVKYPEDEMCRKRVFDNWWKETCKKAVCNLCRAVYPIFEARGVKFPEIRFRQMVSQWGNCRPSGGVLTFNLRLLAAPARCMEYVVVHEFTHFLHPNHSAAFYAFIAEELPDWKVQQERLQKMVETRI